MPGGGSGIPGWFIAIVVIMIVIAVGRAIWGYSDLKSGGLNPFVAREQIEAQVNQTLAAPSPSPGTSIEQRLAELEDLHARGVITDGASLLAAQRSSRANSPIPSQGARTLTDGSIER
jgi:hypothetical protein